MKPFVAVLDNAPLEPAPWMRQVAADCGLFFVDQDAIAKVLAQSQAFQKAMLSPDVKSFTNPRQHPSLAPHYREALGKVAPGQTRLALHGWGWLVFAAQVQACVLDFSGFEAEKLKARGAPGVTPAQLETHFTQAKDVLREAARKAVLPGRVLELPASASDARRREEATAFLKKTGA